jgi:hypothetical protein
LKVEVSHWGRVRAQRDIEEHTGRSKKLDCVLSWLGRRRGVHERALLDDRSRLDDDPPWEME